MIKCYDCKFCDIDYFFDDEEGDEYEIWSCDKGHDTDSEEECTDYKKYNAKKPKETPYECDCCKYRSECSNTIECTESWNVSRHYVKGMGFCRKDSEKTERRNADEIIAKIKENLSENEWKKLDESIKLFGDRVNVLCEVVRKENEND